MVWTKATFWLVADILRAQLAYHQDDLGTLDGHYIAVVAISNIAVKFANAFAKSNERFDREKFIKACGLEV